MASFSTSDIIWKIWADLWRKTVLSAKSGTVGKMLNPRSSEIFPNILCENQALWKQFVWQNPD